MTLIDRHSSPATWMAGPSLHNPVNFGSPAAHPSYSGYHDPSLPPIPPKNDKELTREALFQVLDYFSHLVAQHFGGRPIRLVVHGGACMLLHDGLYKLSLQQQQMSSLPRRTTTRDVDYIHRSFVTEMTAFGIQDAAVRLNECIKGTARTFSLGSDWMNSDADIALPYAFDPMGKAYDPIYLASIQKNNIDLHTIYTAPNKMLTLISVTPFWAVSLKLVRYVRWDPGDICLLLRNGVVLSGTHWTPEQLETWLYTECWAVGYAHFDAVKKQLLKDRILDAINQLKIWNEAVGVTDERDRASRSWDPEKAKGNRSAVMAPPMAWGGRTLSAHDAMGGGEVVGGGDGALSSGWSSAVGAWPDRSPKRSPPAAQGWNVMDWADGKVLPTGPREAASGSGSDRERKKKNLIVAPRKRSISRQRSSQEDLYVPDSDDSDDGWLRVDNPGTSHPPAGQAPGPGQQPQWCYLNPNHAPNSKRPSSRQHSPDPYKGIYGPPDSRQPKGKGLENLSSTLAASLNVYEYGLPHGTRPGHHRAHSYSVSTPYHGPDLNKMALRQAQAEKLRKKKKQERKKTKAIERARSNKWAPRWLGGDVGGGRAGSSETDDESEEEESDESSSDEDGNLGGSRRGQRANGRRDPGANGHGEHLSGDRPWYNAGHAGAGTPAYLQPAGSRPSSRNASPNRMKKRPPPLDLPPPPVIPGVTPPPPHQHEAGNPARGSNVVGTHNDNGQPDDGGIPAHLGPAERAQFQFEQQQMEYHQHLAKQSHQPTVKEVAEHITNRIAAQQKAFAQAEVSHQHHHPPPPMMQAHGHPPPPPPPQHAPAHVNAAHHGHHGLPSHSHVQHQQPQIHSHGPRGQVPQIPTQLHGQQHMQGPPQIHRHSPMQGLQGLRGTASWSQSQQPDHHRSWYHPHQQPHLPRQRLRGYMTEIFH